MTIQEHTGGKLSQAKLNMIRVKKSKYKHMKKIAFLIVAFCLIAGLNSCSDFLDEVPDSHLTPENFYITEADAYAATVAAYSQLASHNLFNNHLLPTIDMISDDIILRPGELTPDLVLLENYQFGPSDADRPTANYNGFFIGIKNANVVIDRIPEMDISESKKNLFVAEARFLRALYFFYAARMFGDLPKVINETTSLADIQMPRSPGSEIYEEVIIPDLQFAEEHLPVNAPEPGRASAGAAMSLLASVYLTMAGEPLNFGAEYYTLARDKAKDVIDMNKYSLFEDFADVFDPKKKNGIEHIFDVQFDRNVEGRESIAMWLHWPRNIGLGNGLGLYMPSQSLIDSFDENDLRIPVTYKTQYPRQSDGNIIHFTPHIWKFFDEEAYSDLNISRASNNFPVLRFAEVLLIFAEASNEVSGPDNESYEAINHVRQRAGLVPLEGLGKEQFREAVYKERRHEFVAECKKWFDLVRTGRLIEVMHDAGKDIQEKHKLFPIPQREMDVNENMVQNPGYD